MSGEATWELTVGLVDGLELRCRNPGPEPRRLWRLDNSWGWSMPSVELLASAEGPVLARLVPAPRVWTKNVPGFEVVGPGRTVTMALGHGDLVPDGDPLDERALSAATPWVVVRLSCPTTPESLGLGVWSGEVSSAPVPWGQGARWWQAAGP
jgi:hypothetical protein